MARDSKLRRIIREELEALLDEEGDEDAEGQESEEEEDATAQADGEESGEEVDDDAPLTRADLKGLLAEMLDERAGGDSTEASEPPASKPETRRRLPAGFTPGRGKADPKPDITGMSPKELAAMDEKALDALSNEQRVERFDTLAKQGH